MLFARLIWDIKPSWVFPLIANPYFINRAKPPSGLCFGARLVAEILRAAILVPVTSMAFKIFKLLFV